MHRSGRLHPLIFGLVVLALVGSIDVRSVTASDSQTSSDSHTHPPESVQEISSLGQQRGRVSLVDPDPADSAWSDRFHLPGLNGEPTCALEWEGKLVVGGHFERINGRIVSRIAAWDGNDWLSLGDGLNGVPLDLVEFQGEVIAVGEFTRAGSVPVEHVARWNGQEWRSLGEFPFPEPG